MSHNQSLLCALHETLIKNVCKAVIQDPIHFDIIHLWHELDYPFPNFFKRVIYKYSIVYYPKTLLHKILCNRNIIE